MIASMPPGQNMLQQNLHVPHRMPLSMCENAFVPLPFQKRGIRHDIFEMDTLRKYGRAGIA